MQMFRDILIYKTLPNTKLPKVKNYEAKKSSFLNRVE